MTSDRERRLEEILVKFLEPIKGVPFDLVIRSLCKVSVVQFNAHAENNKPILAKVAEATRETCRRVQDTPILRPRPNEVGNDMEPFLISCLCNAGFDAARPKTKGGAGKNAGYPDIRIGTEELPIHVEVKTFATGKPHSSFRSFYLSPTEDPKVYEDGHHLLIGFEMQRAGNAFWPVGFEIVDLYDLECDLKAEFNSDNRRLYHSDRVLLSEKIPHGSD